MTLPPPRLYAPKTDSHLLPQLAQIQADCITQDAQLATFLPPLDIPTMTTYWQNVARNAGVTPTLEQPSGCEICLQMAPSTQGEGEVVAGYVVLGMAWSQTGPFRGEVLKLMVSPRFRRMGVARRVMGLLEEVAREKGRTLLTLDTKVGSDAEKVYPKLDYKEVGVIPKYGIDPLSGKLVDERFFYKDLRGAAAGTLRTMESAGSVASPEGKVDVGNTRV